MINKITKKINNDYIFVVVVTACVQGWLIAGQLLASFFVEPELLGRIRWLEAVFSIALLFTSCGMPSVSFRLAALDGDKNNILEKLLHAIILTGFISILVILIGMICFKSGIYYDEIWTSTSILMMGFILIPANAGRITVAVIQGSQLSKMVYTVLLVLFVTSILVLTLGVTIFGIYGWITLRFCIETLFFLILLDKLLIGYGKKKIVSSYPSFIVLSKYFNNGFKANYAFLVRVLSDNLPLLLLPIAGATSKDLGLYGLTNLLLFAPMLMMGSIGQANLPKLIKLINNKSSFENEINANYLQLFQQVIVWVSVMLTISFVLVMEWVSPNYSDAGIPLAVLCFGLPARVFILIAGTAAVAHGWFARSSILALVEILIIFGAVVMGLITDALSMAMTVALALWIEAIPALILIKFSKKSCN